MTDMPLQPPPPHAPSAPESNGLALGSLIAGIASVVLCGLGLLLGPVAVILGAVARHRPGGQGQAMAGIITGIVGTLIGVISVIGLIAFLASDSRAESEFVTDVESQDLLDDAADAGWDQYEGGLQETPCYSFEGAEGWVANLPQTDIDLCFMEYELWAEFEYGDDGEPDVSMYGVGSVVAQVVVEPISDTTVEELFPGRDVETMRTYLLDNYFVSDNFVISEVADATVGGLPATRFEHDSQISDTRVTYVVWTPTMYEAGASGSSDFFLITFVSTFDSIVEGDSVEQSVLDTFTWK
jgi:hypothetical protein